MNKIKEERLLRERRRVKIGRYRQYIKTLEKSGATLSNYQRNKIKHDKAIYRNSYN